MNNDVSGTYLQTGGDDLELADDNARFKAAMEQDSSESFYEKVKTSMAGAVGVTDRTQGVGRGVDWLLDAPKNIGIGAYRAVVNTIDTAADFGAAAVEANANALAGKTPKLVDGAEQEERIKVQSLSEAHPELMQSVYGMADEWSYGNQIEDDLTQGISQFTLPFTGWLKALGGMKAASTAGKVAVAAGAEAATAGSAFAPHDARFADLVQMGRQLDTRMGEMLRQVAPDGSLVNRYIDYLTHREGEGEWEGRFKNVVDSLGTSAAVAGFLKSAGISYKAAKQGIEESLTVPSGGRTAQRGSFSLRPIKQSKEVLPGYSVEEGGTPDGRLDTGSRVQADQDVLPTVGGGRAAQGWAQATRGVGRDRKPLTFYRGAVQALSAEHFNAEALGKATGHPSAGLGVFLSNNADDAARYGTVEEFHLDIRKPKVIKIEDLPAFDDAKAAAKFRQQIEKEGYDSIVLTARHLGGPEQPIVFRPDQVIRKKGGK